MSAAGREETMQANEFFEVAGIPLLLFVVLVYYGVRLWMVKDVTIVRGKNKPPVKDETMYAKWASALILFLAFAALIMAFLLFINAYAALGEFVGATLIMGFLWRRMDQKYGG